MASGDLTDLSTCYVTCNISGAAASGTDTILASLITALSAYVPNVLSRGILSASYSEFYTGNGKASLMLRQRPITSITSIAWEGSGTIGAGNAVSGAAGFWTDGRNARLVGSVFPEGLPIQIGYVAGYATVPPDLSFAVAELVAEAYQRRTHVGEMSRSANGQITTSFDARTMHDAIADKLKNYMAVVPC